MDYFLLLLITYTALLLISIMVFNLKVLSPSIIFTASFSLMIYLAFATKDLLGFAVSELTYNILSIGGILFVIVEFMIMCINRELWHVKEANCKDERKRIALYIRNSTLSIFFLIIIFSLGLALVSVLLSTSGSIGNRMEVYKNMLLSDKGNVKFRVVLNQLYKLNTAIVYVCAYIAVYNWTVCKESISKQKKYFVIVLIFIVYTVFSQGARQPSIEIVLFMFLIYFTWKLKKSDRHKVFRVMRLMIVIAPIAAIVFTKTAELVGRRTMNRKVLTYISTYFCGGLYAFNLHINEPARNVIWGQSSFADIYQLLNKFGMVPDDYVASYHSFERYGNTVTMFGRWYEDFGAVGVYVMVVLVSAFFSILFYRYIYPTYRNQFLHLSKIIYGKLVIALVWSGYDDRIRALISMTNILCILLMIVIYKAFVENHIHIKIGK